MDSFEFNKIAGALLGTILFVMVIGALSDILFHAEEPEIPGYAVILPDRGPVPGEEGTKIVPIASLLPTADVEKGQKSVKKCAACHNFEDGGGNKVGPNLYDIVNRPFAAESEFAYSSALSDLAGENRTWTYEELNTFLEAPKKAIPGTSMGFAGLRKVDERTNVIAYLRILSVNPAPLPELPSDDSQSAVQPVSTGNETASAAGAGPAAMPASAAAEGDAPIDSNADSLEKPAMAVATPEPETDMAAADSTQNDSQPATDAAENSAGSDEVGQSAQAPVLAMVSDAEISDGKKAAKKCVACHSFDEGGKNKIGPVLWDIVDRQIGTVDGYKYSKGLLSYGEGGKTWTYELLAEYLSDPKSTVKGGKMAFAGVRKPEDLAALLAYLASLSVDPVPPPR